MQPVIDALPAIDAVIAGEAIGDEEIGVVEFEALRVLVGDAGRIAADRRGEGGGDRLDQRADIAQPLTQG